jgi:hypothetical protein
MLLSLLTPLLHLLAKNLVNITFGADLCTLYVPTLVNSYSNPGDKNYYHPCTVREKTKEQEFE